MTGSPIDCAAPAVRRISCSNEGKEIKVGYPRAFANFFRMDAQQFQYLLVAVSPLIVHKDTAMRDAIPPAERLAVTLRFLATSILHNYVNVMLMFQ